MRGSRCSPPIIAAVLCALCVGCNDGEGGQDSTYSASSLSAGAEVGDTAGAGADDTNEASSATDESGGTSEGDGDGDSSTSTSGDGDGDSTTTTPGDGDGDADGSTTTTSGDGDGDGDGDGGTQPSNGMYSECSPFDTCAPLVNPTCVSTGSETSGFCSIMCTSAAQCMPVPGAAPAVCDPATGFCMLDCGGGEACPTGLVCTVGDFGAGNVSRCIEP